MVRNLNTRQSDVAVRLVDIGIVVKSSVELESELGEKVIEKNGNTRGKVYCSRISLKILYEIGYHQIICIFGLIAS